LRCGDPATGEILTHVPDLGSIEAERAVLAAQDAFPAWRRRPAQERSNILRRLACLMRAHEADLARIITAEQGKPLAEARGENHMRG
jgi:succinate-semialdehyde dehydrogenase / glutarate-semialdehyde dehydrogenase